MASFFRRVYEINALDGGLNKKYEPSILPDEDSPECFNVVFDDRGAPQTRQGYGQLNTTAVGSFAGDGLFTTRFDNDTQTMVAWWNGTMYQLATTTFSTVPSAQSVWTAGTRVDMAMYQNLAFFGQGNQPYKYNGTEFTRHGIEVPNSTPTVATSSAGTLTGTFYYKVTYTNSYVVQGDVSSNTTAITVAGTRILLTSLPIAPTSYGINARNIYRSNSGVSGTYKLVTSVADNTTTQYEDNQDNTQLTSDAPTDQGKPPNWKFIVAHQDRLFFVDNDDPAILQYTELANPFVNKANNFERFNEGDGETITGLAVHANSVAVLKENSVWLLYMPSTDVADWVKIKTNAKFGNYSQFLPRGYDEGRLLLFGRNFENKLGFFALMGAEAEPNAVELNVTGILTDEKSDKIEPDVFLFNRSALAKACSILFDNKIWIAVPYDSSSTNNRIYQYDFKRRAESKSKGSWVPFTGINAAAFTIYNAKLYFQDSRAVGLVHQLENGTYSDNGTAIDSYLWTKEFFGQNEDRRLEKDFRYGEFILETLGNWNMGISWRVDSDRGSGTRKEVNLSPGGSLWGTMIWGVDLWGGGVTRKEVKVTFGQIHGKTIQFKFDNGNVSGRAFKVIPLSRFYYNNRGLR